VLCQHTQSFAISSKLQELLCLLAQGYVFEEAEEILLEFLGINISAKQIQRVSEQYGAMLEEQTTQQGAEQVAVPVLKLKQNEAPVYVMIDGSMVYSREEGWKEMKVGRLFAAGSCVAVQEKRHEILESLYVCHLGEHKEFLQKWEPYTEPYRNKIIVADGAKWVWNWAEDCYAGAVEILDFYHAVEKLAAYAVLQYKDPSERHRWMEAQKDLLYNDEVLKVIQHLKESRANDKEAERACREVVCYYQNKVNRMQYKTYLEKGYRIGSGAIEAAHRNVVQQRLKLSGQRWSLLGAQQIVNVRACRKSKQWNTLIQLIQTAA
jgi:hypothetical protein